MKNYRLKEPPIVEAFQFDGGVPPAKEGEEQLIKMDADGATYLDVDGRPLFVKTGDYVIKNSAGNYGVLKADQFEAVWEEALPSENPAN